MKFRNQKSFMGHTISNVDNKPLLHKKGKRWIVVAVSALILAGFGGVASTTTHADTTNNGVKTESAASSQANGSANKVSQPNTQTITNQAGNLHKNLVNNSAKNMNNNNGTVNAKHTLGLTRQPLAQSSANIDPDDVNAPKDSNNHNKAYISHGTWDNAQWSYYPNHQLDIYNGTINSPHHPDFPNFHASDVYYIKTSNVMAPVNSSALFAGNGGFQEQSNAQADWKRLRSVDLSGLDTSSTTNMSSMFHQNYDLTNIVFGPTFDTSHVTSMAEMFDDDNHIQSLNMSSFDTSNVTDMTQMFWDMPNLRILDLHNFKLNSNLNATQMFNINTNAYEAPQLKEIVLNSDFKNINRKGADLQQAQINSAQGSNELEQLGSDGQPNGNYGTWSDAASKSGIWINKSSTHTYPLVFQDEFNQNKLINSGQSINFIGLSNSNPNVKIFLPISSGVLPNGYEFSPNEGDTATIDPKTSEAIISIIPKDSLPSKGTFGLWGNAIWMLSDNGDGTPTNPAPATLKLTNGQLITSNIPAPLTGYLNIHHVTINNVQTTNVTAPNDSSNLFTGPDFTNTKNFNLQGMTFPQTANVQNLTLNGSKEFNSSYYYALLNINALQSKLNTESDTINNDKAVLQSDITKINNMTDKNTTLNSELNSAINTINSDKAQITSNSTTASSNSGWIHSNSSSAQSAASWVSNNSQNESNASASASANSNWIKNNSGSLASAYNSATSAMNSLNADSSELNWLNSSEGSISSDDNWVNANSSELNKLNGNWQSVNTRISTDEGNLNKVINTKADSSTLTSDVDTLNKDIRTASGIAAQAKQLANTNSANINTNSANASNSAKNAFSSASSYANNLSSEASNSISASEKAMNSSISTNSNNININSNTASNGISNDNTSASASASIANANADIYALSLANSATGVANENAGGIDDTINNNSSIVQSLSNTVNGNTASLANNDNDLYQTKENKPSKRQLKKQPLFYFYIIKPMWLHTSAKFTKSNRVEVLNAKQGYTLPITRIFKVNGALRFEVRVNGKKYFVTGRKDFVRNAYVQPKEINKHSSVKLLRAVREYKKTNFGKKNFIKNFKKGSVLPVKKAKIIAGKQLTRLQLTNGHWITANKNFVKLI